jgi:hypothetical protein
METQVCCFCKEDIEGMGNNPEPLVPYDEGRCCDLCNDIIVIPERIDRIVNRKRK